MRGPSIYEPFGLVALEAMASGCPCIVADTGGLREVVPVGERVGLRFNGGDAEHLGVMIERLLVDEPLRDRLVTEASEHVLRFDWDDIAQRTRASTASCSGRLRPPDRRVSGPSGGRTAVSGCRCGLFARDRLEGQIEAQSDGCRVPLKR